MALSLWRHSSHTDKVVGITSVLDRAPRSSRLSFTAPPPRLLTNGQCVDRGNGFQRFQYNRRLHKSLEDRIGYIVIPRRSLRRTWKGPADVMHRADKARGLARRAQRGAEIHQGLVEIVRLARRDEDFRKLPELSLYAVAFGIALPNEDSMQDAAHVGVEDRRLAPEGK